MRPSSRYLLDLRAFSWRAVPDAIQARLDGNAGKAAYGQCRFPRWSISRVGQDAPRREDPNYTQNREMSRDAKK
ncbi:hypothetical protein NWFMUON74_07200 [Nocardia wallacei]|uniref:Uncharacterized protein n=1 Tax=Nocardia wallacei TaxID=480035 RepID=A0A7G1KCQ6_9NOCA|nr:hypothetical protein NWFMUON74_07200 [Nocardia wallacei]